MESAQPAVRFLFFKSYSFFGVGRFRWTVQYSRARHNLQVFFTWGLTGQMSARFVFPKVFWDTCSLMVEGSPLSQLRVHAD